MNNEPHRPETPKGSGLPWRSITDPEDVADALVALYLSRGTNRYDELVTQSEHALQCGTQALVSGSTDAMVCAAFLHDIGHLIDRDAADGTAETDRHHELIGARFLSNWFDEEVLAPIRMHVAAKRYLCATDADYIEGLSPASVRSLELQGGAMDDTEVAEFGATPFSSSAVLLRVWDDRAKTLGAEVAPMSVFRSVLAGCATGATR